MVKYYLIVRDENIIGNIQSAGIIDRDDYIEVSEEKMLLDFNKYKYDKMSKSIKLRKETKD